MWQKVGKFFREMKNLCSFVFVQLQSIVFSLCFNILWYYSR